MYKFGKNSQDRLQTCDRQLQEILLEAIKIVDFSILCGYRNKASQDEAYSNNRSRLKWPNSKHNVYPSRAVDVAPYPIDWNDTERFIHLIGIIKGIAFMKGIKIRTGIDWDNDGDIRDHEFMDYPHIELED
jgi:hypothetical protein